MEPFGIITKLLVWDVLFQAIDQDTVYFQGATEAGKKALHSIPLGIWYNEALVVEKSDNDINVILNKIDDLKLSVLTI